MNYDLPEDVLMIKNTVRNFAENVIKPIASSLDAKEEFSTAITKQMGEIGLMGFGIPKEYGGNEFNTLSYIVAVEELARIDGSQAATVAAHNSLGTGPIGYYGNSEQKMKYLPKLCTGEKLWAFGLTESDAGSDAGGTKTKAVKKDNHWLINGSKMFITNGSTELSYGVTVQAITGNLENGKKEYSCFLIESNTKGFTSNTLNNKMMWRASNTSELYFDDCEIPSENILGKKGEGFKQMLETLDRGRLSIAAMGLGCAQGAFEMGLKYSEERKQFGKKIGSFQAVSFKLADIAVEIEAARNMLYKACWLCDQGKDFKTIAAMSKLYCSEVAHRAVDKVLQIHGGYGLMKEFDIERFYRDQRLLEIGEGTSEILRLVIARNLIKNS